MPFFTPLCLAFSRGLAGCLVQRPALAAMSERACGSCPSGPNDFPANPSLTEPHRGR